MKIKGDISFFLGVNICKSVICSSNARYSFLAGSITRNGFFSSQSFRRRPSENVVFPEPGAPTIKICLARSSKLIPILNDLLVLRAPSSIEALLIIPSLKEWFVFLLSLIGRPAEIFSLPIGRQKNSTHSSIVIILSLWVISFLNLS